MSYAGWATQDLYPLARRVAEKVARDWQGLVLGPDDLCHELMEKIVKLERSGRLVKELISYGWPVADRTYQDPKERERKAWEKALRSWGGGICSEVHFRERDSMRFAGGIPLGPDGFKEVREEYRKRRIQLDEYTPEEIMANECSQPWHKYAHAALCHLGTTSQGYRTAIGKYARGEAVDGSYAARAFKALHRRMIREFRMAEADHREKSVRVGRTVIANGAARKITGDDYNGPHFRR
ncbi:hypothetical protein ACFVW2_00645 [Streptomyces sp. NPDC058171]